MDVFNCKGVETIAYAIETIDDLKLNMLSADIRSAEYVGFAFPLYGADIPRIMRVFIKRFLTAAGQSEIKRNMFIINTFGYVNGCGVFRAAKQFKGSLLKLSGYVNLKLTDHSPSINSQKVKFHPPLSESKKQKAVKRLERLVDKLMNGKRLINGIGPHLLVGAVIRQLLKDPLVNTYRHLSVNAALCSRCMQCVSDCPTDSIAEENGVLTFSSTCEACMRCYYFCPVGAIALKR